MKCILNDNIYGSMWKAGVRGGKEWRRSGGAVEMSHMSPTPAAKAA
jgi:hypothetical protein